MTDEFIRPTPLPLRLFTYKILGKTYRVLLTQGHSLDCYLWIGRKYREADRSINQKYNVIVHGQSNTILHEEESRFVFYICCGNDIMIWKSIKITCQWYIKKLGKLLKHENVLLIAEERSRETLANFLGDGGTPMIKSVCDVYKENMLRASERAKRLKLYGRGNLGLNRRGITWNIGGIASDVQLECLRKYEATLSGNNVNLSMDELCSNILGLKLPNFPVMPPLSSFILLHISEVPWAVVMYGAMKVSLLQVLVSSLGP